MTRPNILIVMVDQLTGTLFPDGPADFLHVPHLRALAARSARFARSYTASPLCAPARASFMSGQLPSVTQVYDNAAEFASSVPTFAHHLRAAGYRTVLSGKMHFVGPDQLHGFEERLTTDIYPADFGWTPDYRKPGERIDWWYHNLGSVTGAGVAEITNQLEYDDEVGFLACQKIYDLARTQDRPWCLVASFTHPHDPFVARRKYWDLYEGAPECDAPPALDYAAMDPHSRRLMDACDWRSLTVTPDHIRRARQGYFANISYIDDKVGELLATLAATRQEAVVVFVSDHGEMLGRKGLWFKMNFFEGSSRVPLMIAAPGLVPGRIDTPVSTIDLTPTLCDLAGVDMSAVMPWTEGVSLVPVAGGAARKPVAMEYAAEGTVSPMVGLVEGRWKYIRCAADPEMLFDLQADPDEESNLAQVAEVKDTLVRMRGIAASRWDLDRFDAAVRDSQARRWVVYPALRSGGYFPWDWQPLQRASDRYMRNHMDLNILEESKRFPRGNDPGQPEGTAMIPTAQDLADAYAVTRAFTRRTPLIESEALARDCGAARLFVKAENLQRAGSFKIRGAYWRLTRLSEQERTSGVVAYSSGNFAQGLAAAGQALGVPVTIVMPVDAPPAKRATTEGFGARVVLSHHGDRPREEVASALARQMAEAEGLRLLHPFDDPLIVQGQAGAGIEAMEQLSEQGAQADVVAACVGGGGLMGGVALAFHHNQPGTAIYGVEPVGYDGLGQSLRQGAITRLPGGVATICDALQATAPGEATFAAARAAGVQGVAVSDPEVTHAMRRAFEALKLVAEPSGAVALAAVLSGRVPVKGLTVLVYLTGGNVAFDHFARLLTQESHPA